MRISNRTPEEKNLRMQMFAYRQYLKGGDNKAVKAFDRADDETNLAAFNAWKANIGEVNVQAKVDQLFTKHQQDHGPLGRRLRERRGGSR